MFSSDEKASVQQLISERIQQLEHDINEFPNSDADELEELISEKRLLESVSRKISRA